MLGRVYKVRNNFIELVGDEKLAEQSPIFVYYYNRINDLLSHSPNIFGLEDVLEHILNTDSKDYAIGTREAEKTFNELMNLPEMQDDDVRQAVKDYYMSIVGLILAHSSVLKVLNCIAIAITKILATSAINTLENFANKFMSTYVGALKTLFIFNSEFRMLKTQSKNIIYHR